MKRFRFPFEALELLRRRLRESCELALAQARARRDRTASEIHRLTEEFGEAQEDWRSSLSARGLLDIAETASRRAYVGILLRRIEFARRALTKAEEETEAKRKALLEAARSEKVMERLRARRREEWAAGAAREEQAFLDEAGLSGFRRSAGGLS